MTPEIKIRINKIGKLFAERGDYFEIIKFKNALNSKSIQKDDDLMTKTLDQLEKHILNKINGINDGLIFNLPKKKVKQKQARKNVGGGSREPS